MSRHVPDQLIGYALLFLLIAGAGWGLPRWFDWRRSLRRMLTETGDAARV